jgi:hypothetical protein
MSAIARLQLPRLVPAALVIASAAFLAAPAFTAPHAAAAAAPVVAAGAGPVAPACGQCWD